jgi:hypothetical protein
MKPACRLVAGAVLAFLLAAPGMSLAQRQTPLPEGRQQQIAPFSESLRCVWTSRSIGSAWGGGIVVRELSASNTLSHALPIGTHVTWSYARSGMPGGSGELDLGRPVPVRGVVETGAAFQPTPSRAINGVGAVTSCQIQVSYNMRQ